MDLTRVFVTMMDDAQLTAARGGVGGASAPSAAALDAKRRGTGGALGAASAPLSASAFTRAAGEVSRELHATSAKVQQLTKRACGAGCV